MELKRKMICPMLKKKCIGLDCMWFTKLYGTDPQDKDKLIEEWDCAIVWQVKSLLNVAKHTGQGLQGIAAAVESARNEAVMSADALLKAHATPMAEAILEDRERQRRQNLLIAQGPVTPPTEEH